MSDDWTRVKEILAEATELPENERGAYLDHACGDDATQRARVDALLLAHDEAGPFLGAPTRDTIELSPEQAAGEVIGRYKLLQKIGEGGFGVVYMAEQREPVKRKVALKIIKLGMDTEQVVARFEAERQALAMMEHQNIAKILDGGATDSGRPYFVMELVRGVPITEFCETESLSTRERLALFSDVCMAVQHAHSKGIIHRDLKPSNVLITLHDGKPVPKVIDFGIAKAVDRELTDRTLFTEFRQFVGTPEFMSPEQAALSGLDIDTRSDVYALGVLLYQLLTGTTPIDAMRLRGAGLDEIHRIIREEEPPRPSTRLDSLATEQKDGQSTLATLARHQRSEPQELTRAIRGDLDWIVMKAIEKDRQRRYDTAAQLAEDIGRHLSDEKVLASPPSILDSFRKFSRRNRGILTTAAVVLVLLIAGLVGTSIALLHLDEKNEQLRAAQDEIRIESERTAAVARFFTRMFEDANPFESASVLSRKIDEYSVRELIDQAERTVTAEFENAPLLEAEIRKTLGRTYRGLGELDGAVEQLALAAALETEELGSKHPVTLLTRMNHSLALQERGLGAAALRSSLRLVEDSSSALGPNDALTLIATAYVALDLLNCGQIRECVEQADRLLDRLDDVHFDRVIDLIGTWDRDRIEILALHARSTAHLNLGDAELALADIERAVRLARERPESLSLAHTLGRYAGILRDSGRLDEARRFGQESQQIRSRVFGDEHPWRIEARAYVAYAHYTSCRPQDSIDLYRQVLRELARVVDEDSDYHRSVRSDFAYPLIEVGEYEEACRYALEALRYKEQNYEFDVRATRWKRLETGWMLLEAGRLEEASALLDRALGEFDDDPDYSWWWASWRRGIEGFYLMRQGKADLAEPILLEAVAWEHERRGPDYVTGRRIARWLVELYEETGDTVAADRWRAVADPPVTEDVTREG